MFTLEDIRALLNTRPFVPFRVYLSDGGTVEVRSPEVVAAGRRYAVVGLLDPSTTDAAFDRHCTVWYMHVTRAEQLGAGPPPFSPPAGPSGSPSPAPT
jgi:hypothetical protein